MLTCKDAARLLARDELGASGLERVGLRVHLLMCRFCRRYKAQLRAIADVYRGIVAGKEDPAAIERLERAVLKGLPGAP